MKLFKRKKNREKQLSLEAMSEEFNFLLFRCELLHGKQIDEAERLEKRRKVGREYTI